MSVDAYVDEERKCIVATIEGDFTFESVIEAVSKSVGDPKFRRGFGILSDHTRVGNPITTTQVKTLVKLLASLSDKLAGARWAAYTTKPASYGMMRMLATLAESVPMEIEVFSTREEAENWLLIAKTSDA